MVKDYLKLKNLSFVNGDFQTYKFDKKFDTILSLANHSTFDSGIKSSATYLSKCNNLLKDGGYFLIEGHHPSYEKISDFSSMIENFVKQNNYDINSVHIKKHRTEYCGKKIYFIHLNHTNPAINKNSAASKNIIKNGFNTARQGMKLFF